MRNKKGKKNATFRLRVLSYMSFFPVDMKILVEEKRFCIDLTYLTYVNVIWSNVKVLMVLGVPLFGQKQGAFIRGVMSLMDSVNSDFKHGKILSCMFLSDVLCSFRKSEEFGVMNRCLKCPHYQRFLREMEEEEEEFWEEVDRFRIYGRWV